MFDSVSSILMISIGLNVLLGFMWIVSMLRGRNFRLDLRWYMQYYEKTSRIIAEHRDRFTTFFLLGGLVPEKEGMWFLMSEEEEDKKASIYSYAGYATDRKTGERIQLYWYDTSFEFKRKRLAKFLDGWDIQINKDPPQNWFVPIDRMIQSVPATTTRLPKGSTPPRGYPAAPVSTAPTGYEHVNPELLKRLRERQSR